MFWLLAFWRHRTGARPFLLPAFTHAFTWIGMLGSRIQLQQRNCFRFSRNSFLPVADNICLAKNCGATVAGINRNRQAAFRTVPRFLVVSSRKRARTSFSLGNCPKGLELLFFVCSGTPSNRNLGLPVFLRRSRHHGLSLPKPFGVSMLRVPIALAGGEKGCHPGMSPGPQQVTVLV